MTVKSRTIYWSPVENEFVVYCPIASMELQQTNSFELFIAPSFNSIDITPGDMGCPSAPTELGTLIWSPDGMWLVFSATSSTGDEWQPYSAIWIMNREEISIKITERFTWFLKFGGWMNEQNLVYQSYAGGGHWNVFVFDIETSEVMAYAGVHAGNIFGLNNQFVVTASGADSKFDYSAAVFSQTSETSSEVDQFRGPYIRFLSHRVTNRGLTTIFNSSPLDWLPGSNQLLVLTWDAGISLYDYDLLHDESITDLQVWNVETDGLSLLVPGAINGRFSPDDRFLSYLTPGNPAPYLQLLNRIDGTIAFSVQTIGFDTFPYPTTNASFSPDSRYFAFYTPGELSVDDNGKPESAIYETEKSYLHLFNLDTMQITASISTLHRPVSWSPNNQWLVYFAEDSDLNLLNIVDGRSTPLTLGGGERLSDPQWSFDGSYLSVRVENETGWETAVLQMP